jgi:hemerythrin superfamily protein
MATILKVMFDDHARIKRLFARAKRMPNDLDTALAICQEHDIHTTIEDEIVYPVLEELAPELAEQAEADHEKANGIVDEIYKYDVADSTLRPLVEQLEWITSRHIAFEEAEILPVLKNGLAPQEVIDMGLAAFARRQ